MAFFKESTCAFTIKNSINAICDGKGRYIHPNISVVIKCKKDFFVSGPLKATCADHSSTCEPCNCNVEGSSGTTCDDGTGKCNCKRGFYGIKCENQDCLTLSWGQWGRYVQTKANFNHCIARSDSIFSKGKPSFIVDLISPVDRAQARLAMRSEVQILYQLTSFGFSLISL